MLTLMASMKNVLWKGEASRLRSTGHGLPGSVDVGTDVAAVGRGAATAGPVIARARPPATTARARQCRAVLAPRASGRRSGARRGLAPQAVRATARASATGSPLSASLDRWAEEDS